MKMVDVTLEDGSIIQVRYPRVPPMPTINRARRQEMARDWLTALSQAPTHERVEQLAPLVGRFPAQSLLGKIASGFVASNRLPATEDVIAAYLHRQAIRRQQQASARDLPDHARDHLLDLIDQHWDTHGHGPAWSSLAAHTGLTRQQIAMVLQEMKNAGLVTFTRTPGSLHRTTSST